MVRTFFILLAHYSHGASWLISFLVCVLSVFVVLLVIATLAAIFDPKREPGTRYKVFRDLLGLFLFRHRKHRKQGEP